MRPRTFNLYSDRRTAIQLARATNELMGEDDAKTGRTAVILCEIAETTNVRCWECNGSVEIVAEKSPVSRARGGQTNVPAETIAFGTECFESANTCTN